MSFERVASIFVRPRRQSCRTIILASILASFVAGTACSDDGAPSLETSIVPEDSATSAAEEEDTGAPDEAMLEQLTNFISDRDLTLPAAISAAEASANGTAIEAKIEFEPDGPIYEVDVFVEGLVQVVDLDVDTLAVNSTQQDDDTNPTDEAVDALLAADVDWDALISAAESAAEGTAFEIQANGEDANFEVDVLVGEMSVVEVTMLPDATVVEVSEPSG